MSTDWNWNNKNVDWIVRGKEVSLVLPTLTNKKTGEGFVRLEDIMKASQQSLAVERNINERQIPLLALIYAGMPILHPTAFNITIKDAGLNVREGELRQSRRINKMLFDLWQRTKVSDYGESYPHFEFKKEIYGPVALGLENEIKHLADAGLIDATWEKGHKMPTVVKLTQRGKVEASEVWTHTPPEVQAMIIAVKEFFVLKDIDEIVDYFHEKYPEYHKMVKEESEV